MENKFAKETQNALKNRPTYKKRNKSETWETAVINNVNGKSDMPSEVAEQQHQSHSPRKLILMKEPGELELASAVAQAADLDQLQAASDPDILVLDMDDSSQNSVTTNDENNP